METAVVAQLTWRLVPFLFLLYIVAYLVYRFLTEFIRPEPVIGLGLTFYQWIALLGGMALAAQWWWDARSAAAGQPRAACL